MVAGTTDSTNPNPAQSNNNLSPESKKLILGDLKTLEEIVQFNPKFFVQQRIFQTESMQFKLYCIEPGQFNPMHKHPQSDEICYFVQGRGDIVVGEEIAAVQAGACVHIPKNVAHEIQNTGVERMIVVLVQSPLPCTGEKITDPPEKFRRVELP